MIFQLHPTASKGKTKMKIKFIVSLLGISVLYITCSNDFSEVYYTHRDVFNTTAEDLIQNFDTLSLGYVCMPNKKSEILQYEYLDDSCFKKIPSEIQINLNYLFNNKSITSFVLFRDHIFFNLESEKKLTTTLDYFLIYTKDTSSVSRIFHDNDFKIKRIDYDWYYVIFEFDE